MAVQVRIDCEARSVRSRLVVFCIVLACLAAPVEGGQQPGDTQAPPAITDRPPPPLPPAVIARDAAGRATVRAERIAEPLRIDGRLDEAVYTRVPPMSDFIQNEPDEGAPANERTEVWILFDNENFW